MDYANKRKHNVQSHNYGQLLKDSSEIINRFIHLSTKPQEGSMSFLTKCLMNIDIPILQFMLRMQEKTRTKAIRTIRFLMIGIPNSKKLKLGLCSCN